MNFRPTLDRVAVIREPKEVMTEGGIALPPSKDDDAEQEESNFGKVVAIGSGGYHPNGEIRPVSVKVGDRVFFIDYHTTNTGSDIVLVDDEDILAIVED